MEVVTGPRATLRLREHFGLTVAGAARPDRRRPAGRPRVAGGAHAADPADGDVGGGEGARLRPAGLRRRLYHELRTTGPAAGRLPGPAVADAARQAARGRGVRAGAGPAGLPHHARWAPPSSARWPSWSKPTTTAGRAAGPGAGVSRTYTCWWTRPKISPASRQPAA